MLDKLEAIARQHSPEKRGELLLAITDVVIRHGLGSPELESAYADIVRTLLKVASHDDKSNFARRVAPHNVLPHELAMSLAQDELEIARDILRLSPKLGENELVAIVKNNPDDYRLAVAQRETLTASVTSLLVELGGLPVKRAIGRNHGAKITAAMMAKLVALADTDEALCQALAQRMDVPPDLAEKLVQSVARLVKARMVAGLRPKVEPVEAAPAPEVRSLSIKELQAAVASGKMTVDQAITTMAEEDRTNDLAAFIAQHAGLDDMQVMRVLVRADAAGIVMVIRGLGLSAETWAKVVALRARRLKLSPTQIRFEREDFVKLEEEKAKTTLDEFRHRKVAGMR